MRALRSRLVGVLVASILTAASAATLGAVTTTPAQAACTTGLNDNDCDGDGIPNRFEEPNWYSSKGTTTDGGSDYTYVAFPPVCTPSGTNFVHQALWLYDADTAVIDKRSVVRDIIAGANSIFAASAKEVYTTQAQLNVGHFPKWVTNATTCQPVINNVAIPHATWLAWKSGDIGTVWSWLNANGYNQPGVKYVEFGQETWGAPNGGLSSGAGYQNNTPGIDNHINYTSHSAIPLTNGTWTTTSHTLAHEMVHNLGASYGDQPHYNFTTDNGHPTDCGDLMCYSPGTPGQVYNIGCGGLDADGFPTATLEKSNQRLDCNDDDYFNGSNPSWASTRYNIWNSPYLRAYTGSAVPAG